MAAVGGSDTLLGITDPSARAIAKADTPALEVDSAAMEAVLLSDTLRRLSDAALVASIAPDSWPLWIISEPPFVTSDEVGVLTASCKVSGKEELTVTVPDHVRRGNTTAPPKNESTSEEDAAGPTAKKKRRK